MAPIDIAVLVSGSGSNLQALIDRVDAYRIAVAVADRDGIRALDRARLAGIPTRVVPWEGDRARFTTAICDAVEAYGVELVVLAGFMRILGPEAIRRYPGRIVNIHPSLLPAFPGADAVDQALEHAVRVTGVTVHFVDEEVDHGPIIAQVPVMVMPGDTVESLHARIQEQEHLLYPNVVSALARGEIVVGRPPAEVTGT
ncbi:MAG: phosphoribosylglycinamide formyltransferase [Acidimicrobiia bacterium]